MGFEFARGAVHEARFLNRAGVLAFGVQAAPVQIDLPQAAVQESPHGLGVALEVKAVRAGVKCDSLSLLPLFVLECSSHSALESSLSPTR